MNKKGQLNLGLILVTFIAIIVGVILFQTIAQQAGQGTTLTTLNNVTTSVVNGTTTYLDYRALSGVIVTNASTGNVIVPANYTITNNVIDPSDGTLSVSIIVNPANSHTTNSWNISATAQPTTYIADSGGRAMVSLIAIFFALAVVIVALTPTLRSGVLSLVGK